MFKNYFLIKNYSNKKNYVAISLFFCAMPIKADLI